VASKQLQDLKLSEDQAEKIIEHGIALGATEADEVPESKKEKIAAAQDAVASALDAWVEDEIRPDDDDSEVAEAGERIVQIFEIAGITVDDDGEVTIGEPEDSGDDDEDDNGNDDESPFNPDDYIEGYSELSVVSKLARIKKLNPEDDDDAAVLEAIAEWENEQEKPSSRILDYIAEMLGDEGDSDETADEAGGDDSNGDEEGSASEEPWDGYDKLSATDIKKVLKEASEDEENPLTADQVEYVLEYEQSREKPPARKRVIDFCQALLDELQGEGDDNGDDEPEAEDEPEKPKRGRGRGRPAKADKPGKSKPSNDERGDGVIKLTREQILTALEEGEVSIEI